ncbi:MAG: HlyD family secretion protein [bacterium]
MKSEKIQNPYTDVVLGRIPSWISNWGIIVVFLTLSLLTLFFHFIHYPLIIAKPIYLIEKTSSLPLKNSNDICIVGEMKIIADEIVRIKKGMEINIKLNAYNSNKYGVIKGVVDTISYSGKDAVYIVTVYLPEGLVTSYGKEIIYTKGLTGVGNIVINETTMLTRIVQPIKELYQN